MPIGPARMPLMDHLGELRMRIVRIIVVLAAAIILFYFAAPTIGQFLLLPIADLLPKAENGASLFAFTPFESFGTRFKLAFWTAIVACAPIIIWQVLAFFLPALRPRERRWFIPTFATAVALFIIGVIFCYGVILHTAFQWLIDQSEGLGDIIPQMSAYIDMIIKFEIGFGLAFQLPLIVFYLVVFRIIPYTKLRKSWRVVYLVLLIFCAIITPDGSPVTLLLLFGALIALYEISLAISRVVLSKRIRRERAEEAETIGEENLDDLTDDERKILGMKPKKKAAKNDENDS